MRPAYISCRFEGSFCVLPGFPKPGKSLVVSRRYEHPPSKPPKHGSKRERLAPGWHQMFALCAGGM